MWALQGWVRCTKHVLYSAFPLPELIPLVKGHPANFKGGPTALPTHVLVDAPADERRVRWGIYVSALASKNTQHLVYTAHDTLNAPSELAATGLSYATRSRCQNSSRKARKLGSPTSLAPMAGWVIIVLDRSVGGQRVGWALQGWVRSIKLVFCSVYATQDSCPLSKTVAKRGKAAFPVPAPADELRALEAVLGGSTSPRSVPSTC